MKRFVFVCSMLCMSLASFAGVKYTILGKAPQEMNGEKVYLSMMSKNTRVPQDSARIENGAFVFKGETERNDIASVYQRRGDYHARPYRKGFSGAERRYAERAAQRIC